MSGVVIGVDVGGTKVALAALRDGKLDEPTVLRTERSDASSLIEEIVGGVRDAGGADAEGVGVGIPSVVEFATGRARSSVNVPLEDVPLRRVLRERLGVPVFIDNDATVAALAEAYEGGQLAVRNLVMLTLGTGVGGGLVVGGRVCRGATGAAGEVGHTIIGAGRAADDPGAEQFPKPGSLESLASGRALDRLAARAARDDPGSALGRLAAGGHEVSGRDAVEAAKQGDEPAARVLRELGASLGIGIANAVNTFDPDVVAVGGGVSEAGELLLAPAREAARRLILPGVGERTEIRLARSGPEAGVLGAALLARQELEVEGGRVPEAAGGER